MNAPSSHDLLTELQTPDPDFTQEDNNIWGLLFGAAFSMQQAEWTMKKIEASKKSGVDHPPIFSQEVFDVCLSGFDKEIDLSEFEKLEAFFPWLAGFYLNSSRLRTVFAFENTVAKCYRRLVDFKKNERTPIIQKMLCRVAKETENGVYPLIAPLEQRWRTPKNDEVDTTREGCLYFLHQRVNDFKHNTYKI